MLELIKVKSKKTFTDNKGKERNVIYYALRDTENNKKVLIKPCFVDDYKVLDYLAKYEKEN